MKLKENVKHNFFFYSKRSIVKNRALSSEQIIQSIMADDPKLYKSLKAAKADPIELVHILLSELSQDGSIVLKNKKWTLKKSNKFCRYCAQPLDEVYLQDVKGRRFCNNDCLEELYELEDEHIEDEEPYWEDYLYLYGYYRDLYPYHWLKKKLSTIKGMDSSELTFFHLSVLNRIHQLDIVFNEETVENIERLEGADGPIAREMYRIINLLRKEEADFEKAEEVIRKRRGDIKKQYGVFVDSDKITPSIQQSTEWKAFKQKNKRYKDQYQFLWTTADLYRRNDWHDQLSSIFGESVGYKNLVQCPICSKWEEDKYMRMQDDQFQYCLDCSDEHHRSVS